MKRTVLLLIIVTRICFAQVPSQNELPPFSQSHNMPPWMQQYAWDTIANIWVYVKTLDITYSGTNTVVTYAHDTVAGVPLQVDSTSYDSLGRLTAMWSATWTGVWMNGSKTEYIYTDTSDQNRVRFRYAGNGNSWTLIQGDSVYNIFDTAGNSIDRYFSIFNISSGTFKPAGRTLTDYDLQNRVQRRQSYSYDTTAMQYNINQLDSNFQYDIVWTTVATDMIQYTYPSGIQNPYYRYMIQVTGPTINDRIETSLLYNNSIQQWENLNQWTFTTQICEYGDSAYLHRWNSNTSQWELNAGTKDIYHMVDSCEYDELIFMNYFEHLNAYRNSVKWVYPPYVATGLVSEYPDHSIQIFPNPFHEKARMEIGDWGMGSGDWKSGNVKLRIFNSTGSLVHEEKILNLKSYILNRDGLNDGLYFYEFSDENADHIGSGKFIVQ